MWICDIVLEWLKKIYGWKIWFEYNYLQSRLVIVRFQTEALFTASLMQERWKVKKNYSCILCASNINTVVSSMSCFVVVYFLKAITYMYLAFTSKKQGSKGLLTGDQKGTFSLQSASFVHAKANESHPMHGAVIFRMKGKCTLLERALYRLEI